MRRATSLAFFSVLATAQLVWAAQAVRRPAMGQAAREVMPPPGQPVPAPAPVLGASAFATAAASNPQCGIQRSILQQQQVRLDNVRAEVAGIESEMQNLRQRMQQLEARRGQLNSDVQSMQQQTNVASANVQRMCPGGESCADYEARTAQLRTESAPVEEQMNALRTQIGAAQTAVAQLDQQVQGLRRDYSQRACNNLQPGQTSQVDIDRCMQIFSEWNRAQMAVNQQSSALPMLRSRYDQLALQQGSVNRRAQDLRQQMTNTCRNNPRINDLNQFAEVQQRAAAMQQQLDTLTQAASRLAEVRITVGP
jgi:chromosome segregation ATPase